MESLANHSPNVFYAHTGKTQDKSDWQSLRSHLVGTGDLARIFARPFAGDELAWLAGVLHDLGKYTNEFQQLLCGNMTRVDHSTWGARVAVERYGPLGQLLAYAIAGHHAGLANGKEKLNRTALIDRLKSELCELLPAWKTELQLPAACKMQFPSSFRPNAARLQFQLAILVRMLFSCLVDADFIDTEAYYASLEGMKSPRASSHPSLEQLREKLDQRLSGFQANSEVNRLRAEILTHVRKQAPLAPGLFSLTVPTGGGKTLASMAFALDHAIRHGQSRVIFVIPFTSIVEQNAAVFRDAFGDLGEEAVLEHHSAFTDDVLSNPEARDKLRLAMENWDYPIIVTTAVQFFESLFADRPSRCRKLHNIANSVVILDEAQTLPLKLLRPCVATLDELALNYRTSIVLCTATQPALTVEAGFSEGLKGVREIAPEPPRLYEKLKRVKAQHVGLLSGEQLTAYLRDREQVLCIVNNRRHARALYQSIADQTGAMHLTTLMCAQHRRQVLAEVRQRLKEGRPCRLVSTSLIEAGVDVDFPVVMRAEAGLDSIAQAAGRCNREGRRPLAGSEVLIFAVDSEDWAPPPELKQFAQVFRAVQRQHGTDLLSLAAVEAYFKDLYWQKGALALDAHDLLGILRDSHPNSLPFETIANLFRFIENLQMPVIVPFDAEAERLVASLEYATSCGGIARRLQAYLVQLPRPGYEALYKAGAIKAVAPERYGEQFMVLINPDLYNAQFGLSWDNPNFLKAESMVV